MIPSNDGKRFWHAAALELVLICSECGHERRYSVSHRTLALVFSVIAIPVIAVALLK